MKNQAKGELLVCPKSQTKVWNRDHRGTVSIFGKTTLRARMTSGFLNLRGAKEQRENQW